MGRNSSGNRGGMIPGDFNFKGRIENIETLKNIKDPKLYRAVANAVSRYHSVLGVRQKNVKLADMDALVNGVHVTTNGKSTAIYLNKDVYRMSYSSVEKMTRQSYQSGWSTRTNKPVAHTVTHELAHATWNSRLIGTNQRAAGREIRRLYSQWKKDKSRSGYGKYSKTNINEWFAETTTRAVHGSPDKYTRGIKDIIRRYKL